MSDLGRVAPNIRYETDFLARREGCSIDGRFLVNGKAEKYRKRALRRMWNQPTTTGLRHYKRFDLIEPSGNVGWRFALAPLFPCRVADMLLYVRDACYTGERVDRSRNSRFNEESTRFQSSMMPSSCRETRHNKSFVVTFPLFVKFSSKFRSTYYFFIVIIINFDIIIQYINI